MPVMAINLFSLETFFYDLKSEMISETRPINISA